MFWKRVSGTATYVRDVLIPHMLACTIRTKPELQGGNWVAFRINCRNSLGREQSLIDQHLY